MDLGQLYWATGIDNTGLERDSKKSLSILKGALGFGAAGAVAAVTAGVIKLGKEITQISKEFETAMAEVRTISAYTRDKSKDIADQIHNMTLQIPVDATMAAKALYQIVSAGYDGADAMTLLEISAKAAVAGVTDTFTAADTLTTIINAYGMSVADANRVSDQLFKTVELGKTTLSEIGSSFSQVASIAATYGISVESVLAGISSITVQGAQTGEAITRLRGAIVSLSKEFGPAVFEGRNLGEAFQFARDQADKSGKTYEEFFGRVEASTGILQLTGKNLERYTEHLEKIGGAAGVADAAFKEMAKTSESIDILLKNALIARFQSLGDAISGVAKKFKEAMLDVLETDDQRISAAESKYMARITGSISGSKSGDEARERLVKQFELLGRESGFWAEKLIETQGKFAGLEGVARKAGDIQGILLPHIGDGVRNENIKLKSEIKSAEANIDAIRSVREKIRQMTVDPSLDEKFGKKEDPGKTIIPFDVTAFREKLETAGAIFATYNTLQSDKAREQFEKFNQLYFKDGENFKAYLLNKLEQYKGNSEALIAIEEVATSESYDLYRDSLAKIEKLPLPGFVDLKITEGKLKEAVGLIESTNQKIAQLEKQKNKATSRAEIKRINELIALERKYLTELEDGYQQSVLDFQHMSLSMLRDEKKKLEFRLENYQLLNSEVDELKRQLKEINEIALTRVGDDVVEITSALGNALGGFDGISGGLQTVIQETTQAIVGITNLIVAIAGEDWVSVISSGIGLITQAVEWIIKLVSTTLEEAEELTGTTLDQMSDDIARMFAEGKTSAEDFATYMNDVIREAIISSFKANTVSAAMKPYLKLLGKSLEDSVISEEEQWELDQKLFEANVRIRAGWDAISESIKQLETPDEGPVNDLNNQLAGAIKQSITEDTASVLAGQMGAISVNTWAILEESRRGNSYLSAIEENTRRALIAVDDLNSKVLRNSTIDDLRG